MFRGASFCGLRAVGAISLFLSACWAQPGFDGAHTRWNPWEDQLTAANVATLTEVWSAELPGWSYEPLVAGGRVFLPVWDDGPMGVRAIDAATGQTVWEETVTPPEVSASTPRLTFVEGELWLDYSALCAHGTARLDTDGNVLDLDTTTVPMSRAVQSGPYLVQSHLDSCMSNMSQTLSVRDSQTLETLWTANREGDIGRSLSVSGDLVFWDDAVYQLEGCGAPTCTPIWEHSDGGRIIGAGHGTDVFVIQPGPVPYYTPPEFYAVSRTTGEAKWFMSFQLDSYQGGYRGHAVDDQHFYLTPSGSNSMLLAFDVNGCGASVCPPTWWASDNSGESGTAPTVAGGVIYVGGADGIIHAYAADGCGSLGWLLGCTEIASIDTGFGEVGIDTMSVADGRLFAASEPTDGTYQVKAFAPVAAP